MNFPVESKNYLFKVAFQKALREEKYSLQYNERCYVGVMAFVNPDEAQWILGALERWRQYENETSQPQAMCLFVSSAPLSTCRRSASVLPRRSSKEAK
jgi:hypothetical protein